MSKSRYKLIHFPLLLLITSISATVFGQSFSNPLYQNLDTFYFYDKYEISNGPSSDLFVDSLMWQREELRKGKQPKYVKHFDTLNNLEAEYICVGDCNIGLAKSYWLNGNLKTIANFKQFEGETFDSLQNKDCNILDGSMLFFKENGDTLYTEIWSNGAFILQQPMQKKAEIWGMDICLFDSILSSDTIKLNELSQLTFLPKFKNNNTNDSLIYNLSVTSKNITLGSTVLYVSPIFYMNKIPYDIWENIIRTAYKTPTNTIEITINAISKERYGFYFNFTVKK